MKIISILTIFLIVLYILTPITFAQALGGQQISVDFNGAPTEMVDMGNSIIGVIQVIGIIIAVVIITVLGIKYMLGSAEEKAASKKSMMPYLVGAICVFAATVIIGTAANWVDSKITTVGSSGGPSSDIPNTFTRLYTEPAQIFIPQEQAHEIEWWENKENINQLLHDNNVKLYGETTSGDIMEMNNWIIKNPKILFKTGNAILVRAKIYIKAIFDIDIDCTVDVIGFLSD